MIMKKIVFIIGCVLLFSGCATTTDSAVSAVTETTDSAVSVVTKTTEAAENVVQEVINTPMSDNVPVHNRSQNRDHHHRHHHHKHHKHSGKKASQYRKSLIHKNKSKHYNRKKH